MESGENTSSGSIPANWQEAISQYEPKVKGLKAACGLIVGDISKHAARRIVGRNVTESELLDNIINSSITYPGNEPNTICQQHNDLRVVFNDTTGRIVSLVRLEED